MRALAVLCLTGVLAGTALASAPPVGALPAAKVTRLTTTRGQLVSIALPRHAGGYVWRIARAFDSRVLRQVSEGEVGPAVVLVFKAVGRGHTAVTVAETRGERAKAYRAVRYIVTVS
ncbi:MAG TPA: hypothetical protein VLK53_01215 [Gaiellaceae bacterium]|nr:hypothetical protein [Gaiellaceae bacterium]